MGKRADMKIRTAVCGTGFGADTIIPVLKGLGCYDILGLSGGRDGTKTRRLARRLGVPANFDSFEEMLDKARPDLVFIASPHDAHGQMVAAAAARGLHVVCEKPLALTLPEVRRLAALPNPGHRLRLVNHQLQFLPLFRKMRDLAMGGVLGQVRRVKIDFKTDRLCHPATKWAWWFDPRRGGGMLLAMGSHMVGLAGYLSGRRPLSADAFLARGLDRVPTAGGSFRKQTSESLFASRLYFSGGLFAELSCSGISSEGTVLRVEVQCARGELVFDDRTGASLYTFGRSGRRHERRLPAGQAAFESGDSIYRVAFRRFAAELAVELGSPRPAFGDSATTFAGYLGHFSALEAMKLSARSGAAVAIQHETR